MGGTGSFVAPGEILGGHLLGFIYSSKLLSKRVERQVREIAQWAKCLPSKQEDLSSDPQHPSKSFS